MKEKYIKIKNLSVSESLANFINKELLPGTKINKEKFWKGFNKSVHDLTPKNRKLLQKRERLQKAIDALHIDQNYDQLNLNKYTKFLIKIGYLKKPGSNFKIRIRGVNSITGNNSPLVVVDGIQGIDLSTLNLVIS